MAEAMSVDPTSAKTAIWNVYKKNKDVFTSASMTHALTHTKIRSIKIKSIKISEHASFSWVYFSIIIAIL